MWPLEVVPLAAHVYARYFRKQTPITHSYQVHALLFYILALDFRSIDRNSFFFTKPISVP